MYFYYEAATRFEGFDSFSGGGCKYSTWIVCFGEINFCIINLCNNFCS